MAKLRDCQFIEIKIDDNVIKGSSEEEKYKGWMEGYASAGQNSFSGPDGTYFESIQIAILATKETSAFYEYYLKRGYNKIDITVVHRGSDKYDQNYEVQRSTYYSCDIQSLNIEKRDEQMFMCVTFSVEKMIEVVFNVPNATGTGLDKIGPIKYSIPEKMLK